MLSLSLIFLLLSNAVTSRQDKSILFSRVVIIGLIYSSYLAFNNLFTQGLEKGVGIYGGLFNVTSFTQTFNIFIFIVSAVILTLYSLSNLNAFIILISIGFTFYLYVYKEKKPQSDLIDENNSPIQLISQIKGYFYINSYISISLAVTLFSFVVVTPMIGFFAKQMILSAALSKDAAYIFMSLIAILTSVISVGYYLNRKNIILMLISIEIMLLAITFLILISSLNFADILGQVYAIYIIAIARAKSAIGLDILVAFYRLRGSIAIELK